MDEPSSPEGNAITLRIKFKSANLNEFVARYGADVSAGGIFIRTKQPLAVGSLLRFDFSLADGSPLLAGIGTVVWIREPDQSRVGSIPGMGLRFDQLAPESQPIHQQILAAKTGRTDRPFGTPPPGSPAPPAARPPARPATPPPIVPLPAAAPPAQPSRRETSDTLEEFGSAGKTEIADKPPSFFFDSSDSERGARAGARQEGAPAAPIEDTETDSQKLAAADSSWSEPIDISDDVIEAVPSTGAGLPAIPADSGQAKGIGEKLARQPFDLPPSGGDEPAPVADVSTPSAPVTGATAGRASSGAIKTAKGQSWLDQAMDMPDSAAADAAPLETSAEHTEEMPAPAEPVAAPAPASGEAQRPAFQDAAPFGQNIPEQEAQKPARQGKKLIVVAIVAAGLAFAGVYLLQSKRWQTQVAPVSPPTPAVPAPSPVVPPPVPREPIQPAVPAAPPAAQAKPVKPVQNVPAPKPTEAPAQSGPKLVEAATPEGTVAPGKRPDQAAGSAKKTASKLAPSLPPGSPAPAGQQETVYLLKLRSLPVGAQVLIDDEPMGQTPFQRRILDIDKSHKVTIRKPGYEPYEHIVTPADAWAKDGNTENMKLVAKLKRIKVQADVPSAVPEAQSAPVPEQPKQP